MHIVLNKKSTKEITLCSVGFIQVCLFFFARFKKYPLKNIAIHAMCIFTENITTHKEKNGIYIFSK